MFVLVGEGETALQPDMSPSTGLDTGETAGSASDTPTPMLVTEETVTEGTMSVLAVYVTVGVDSP